MRKTIEEFCLSCSVCDENKRRSQKREPLQPMRLDTSEPRNTIAMDVATLPWSSGGYRYMLSIIDLFAKFIEIVPLYDQTAGTISDALMVGWIYAYRHGVPKVLLTDKGRNVDGRSIRELCSKFGITKKHSSSYHPEGDGRLRGRYRA